MGKYTSLSQQQILILRKAIKILMEFSNARDENPLFDAGMSQDEGDFVREFYQGIGREGVQLNSIDLPDDELIALPRGGWQRVDPETDLSSAIINNEKSLADWLAEVEGKKGDERKEIHERFEKAFPATGFVFANMVHKDFQEMQEKKPFEPKTMRYAHRTECVGSYDANDIDLTEFDEQEDEAQEV